MKSSLTLLATALLMIFTTQSGWSQLVSRGEALIKRYDDDRAKGLIRLNETYLRQLREEMATATRAARLEEATALKAKVDALEAENAQLNNLLTAAREMEASKEEHLLVGKTIHFPHNRDQSFTARFAFRDEGKVNWIGLGNAKVEWHYKQEDTPLVFRVWMPGRPAEQGTIVTIDPEATEAVVQYGDGTVVDGQIKRSDREEAEAP